METICNGVQRSLQSIADKTRSICIPRYFSLAALDREKKWEFTPIIKEGDLSSGRDV